eukprot:Pgem_evm1s18669
MQFRKWLVSLLLALVLFFDPLEYFVEYIYEYYYLQNEEIKPKSAAEREILYVKSTADYQRLLNRKMEIKKQIKSIRSKNDTLHINLKMIKAIKEQNSRKEKLIAEWKSSSCTDDAPNGYCPTMKNKYKEKNENENENVNEGIFERSGSYRFDGIHKLHMSNGKRFSGNKYHLE